MQPMSHEMTVRAARPGDEHAVADVHVRTWQAAYSAQFPRRFLDELQTAPYVAMWRDVITDPRPSSSQLFVLEDRQRVIGFTHVMASRDDDAGGEVGEITSIYVHPERWRAGGGRLLLVDALMALNTAGFSVATLWVLDTNERARRFYEGLGWVPDGASKEEQREDFTLREVRYRRSTST